MYSFVEKHSYNPEFIDMYASVKEEFFGVFLFLFNLCVYICTCVWTILLAKLS